MWPNEAFSLAEMTAFNLMILQRSLLVTKNHTHVDLCRMSARVLELVRSMYIPRKNWCLKAPKMSKRWTNLPLSDEQTYSLNIVLFNTTSLFNRSMWLCSWLTMQSWKEILYGCAFLNISKPVKCFNFKVLPPGNSLLHFSEIDWEISSVWIRIYQRSKCHFSTFRSALELNGAFAGVRVLWIKHIYGQKM